MASLMHLVVENYNEILVSSKDPMVDSWLFMKSPLPVTFILMFYLCFVLKGGPSWMENREPFQLTNLLIFYNAYQVLFSIWLCSHALSVNITPVFTNTFTDSDQDFPISLSKVAWWYFFSKIIELLDTVFFILRKKQSQVTFLHVYHHSCTMFFSWCYLKFLPGPQGLVIGFLNTLVHVIMYTYYFIAALGPKYKKYLWWKKYMTWIQLTQFCIMLVYLFSLILMDSKMPKALTFFFVANVVVFLYLFADFYIKAYTRPKKNIRNNNNNNNDDVKKELSQELNKNK